MRPASVTCVSQHQCHVRPKTSTGGVDDELTSSPAHAYVLAMRFPPLLGAGARVALVAPSGPLRGATDLERAMSNARELGWDPVPGAHVLERDGFFAGSDANRLADFAAASSDDSIDGVWCIRGGYGAMR